MQQEHSSEHVAPCIKVIGVGGAGCNALDHMVTSGLVGVEFIAVNTDAQALRLSRAPLKIAIGTLGAGGKPEVGQAAARAQRIAIEDALRGADMAFITAGMGGGTGTGAAPVVAEIAKEMGILTVGVATKPFSFEGNKRMRAAETGLAELSDQVAALIVVLNDRLLEVLPEDSAVDSCFQAANDVLKNAVGGISEIITNPGLVNVDFQDVRTVMGEIGRAMMGTACAAGEQRARTAAEQAVSSPLLEGGALNGARGVLVNITGSRNGMKLREVTEVMTLIREHTMDDAEIIFGAGYDDSLGEAIRVTVVATGLGGRKDARPNLAVVQEAIPQRATGTYGGAHLDFNDIETPAVLRRTPRGAGATQGKNWAQADIPAFLRRQAD